MKFVLIVLFASILSSAISFALTWLFFVQRNQEDNEDDFFD